MWRRAADLRLVLSNVISYCQQRQGHHHGYQPEKQSPTSPVESQVSFKMIEFFNF
ncbi:uncharacterized protein BCR38DRAFT_436022 [Pseudomassariella vexata]|uniref:Uncharacterized protein n=1 Tax=Pseudomassariella vexata TaxID=1141098 RepID=A0A1Y2DV67_9PEZI|nr:uncharacterized protein BCR38DRAFT_436022 [Pseudomassariella vexata]ORY63148.1 hypothetical protein BCR38DRAFT_436022 [Pseudomassariella vexata]